LSSAATLSIPRLIRLTLVVVVIAVIYAVSLREAQIDILALITGIPNGLALVRDFFTPDVLMRETASSAIALDFPVPCGSAPEAVLPDSGPRIVPSVLCDDVGSTPVVEGFDLHPGSEVRLWWILQGIPDQRLRAATLTADSLGYFRAEVEVRPIVAAKGGKASELQAEVSYEVGGLKPSPALLETVDAAVLTLFMALIATSLAALVAVPISFLAAANVTRHGALGSALYYVARAYLNVTRTFEPLVLATIFGLWVGFGAFAGVLALTVFTVGSLGKLYAEAVESIDPGPVEAVAATGANGLQTIIYAVIPQVVPEFMSFSVYHWDINVRISTIIGFVGGGGIGFLLNERLRTFSYHKAGTAILAIVVVVSLLDLFSAQIRKGVT
jgi:phosphonate transport system permease protein